MTVDCAIFAYKLRVAGVAAASRDSHLQATVAAARVMRAKNAKGAANAWASEEGRAAAEDERGASLVIPLCGAQNE